MDNEQRNIIEKQVQNIISGEIHAVISPEMVVDFLTSDLEEVRVFQVSLDLEKHIDIDAMTRALEMIKEMGLPQGERRILIGFAEEEVVDFASIRRLEAEIQECTGCVPLVFACLPNGCRNDGQAAVRIVVTTGVRRRRKGLRLAFDLDETLTRWPEQFAEIARANRAVGGRNFLISTRHEYSGSTAYKAVYERERCDIERTGVPVDMLVHAWMDFAIWRKLCPFIDNDHWFDRFVWTKALFCRLFRVDAFYEDQQVNIDRMSQLAPDVHIIKVERKTPPTMPEALAKHGRGVE